MSPFRNDSNNVAKMVTFFSNLPNLVDKMYLGSSLAATLEPLLVGGGFRVLALNTEAHTHTRIRTWKSRTHVFVYTGIFLQASPEGWSYND